MGAPLDYQTLREDWNVYQLEDGTILRMKCVLVHIESAGADADGNPKYAWRTQILSQAEPLPKAEQKAELLPKPEQQAVAPLFFWTGAIKI